MWVAFLQTSHTYLQYHGCIGFLMSFEVWWRWQQPSEGSLNRTGGCRRELASANSGIRHSSWPRSKWRGRGSDLSLRMSNSLWQTAHISATYGHRFPCSWIWFLLTLVALRVLITVITAAIFYIFLLGLICVVLPIVWVSEGYKPCHHQSQIKHSSWQAIVCDLCSFDTSNTGGGSHTNTCLCFTVSFHVWKLRNHLKGAVCHFHHHRFRVTAVAPRLICECLDV